jgi:hypothetical protein
MHRPPWCTNNDSDIRERAGLFCVLTLAISVDPEIAAHPDFKWSALMDDFRTFHVSGKAFEHAC